MNDFFKEIFEYQHHYNQQLADLALAHLDKIPEEPLKLFSHVLNAHQIWNSRILQQPTTFKVWEILPPQNYKEIDRQNFVDTLRILEQVDLSSTVSYVNSQGQAFSNTARDILFHVSNHCTYHRGQLASRFKALDIKPLVSDYIFYKR